MRIALSHRRGVSLLSTSTAAAAPAAATAAAPSSILIKVLRERTDAPILECKSALAATGNDLDKAVEWLSARHQKVAATKSGRATNQGLVGVALSPDGKSGAIVQVQCETDFVTRNADFQAFAREIASIVLSGKEPSPTMLSDLVGKFRENIVIGSRAVLRASNDGVLGRYLHGKLSQDTGKFAALVALSKPGSAELADKIALHVGGANPRFLSRDDIPKADREAEEARILAAEASKPPAVQAKIVQGRMQKYYAENCLNDQAFIVGEDEGTPIKKLIGAAKIEGFVRL